MYDYDSVSDDKNRHTQDTSFLCLYQWMTQAFIQKSKTMTHPTLTPIPVLLMSPPFLVSLSYTSGTSTNSTYPVISKLSGFKST